VEVHDAAQGVVSLILIFCVLRREAAFVTSWSGRCSQGRQVSGRKGAPQLPSADADEARLYISLLLQGKLYHHLLLVHTDHLTSRANQGAALEDETRPLPGQDVDQVGCWQEANLPTLATPQPPPVLVSRVKQVKPASRSCIKLSMTARHIGVEEHIGGGRQARQVSLRGLMGGGGVGRVPEILS